ncbi:TonB-dependent siderophore receptor [Pseudomonas japonica]|nr:TonB-dependent siderophore receptor [Pseudomonas japonica]
MNSRIPSTPTPMRALLRSAFLSLGLAATLPLVTHAQAAEQVFSIPVGTLDQALTQLSRETGLNIAFNPADLAGKHSHAVQGRFSAEQALAQLLAGSGLQAVALASGGYRLIPQAGASTALELDATSVMARETQDNPLGPVAGYIARRTTTATKTDTPILENPQAISVITRERMDDMGAQRLDEVLRYTSGVRTDGGGANNAADNIFLRGYAISLTYRDGLRLRPLGFFGMFGEEPYGLERVEVLKGPTSILYGQSEPGGMVNTISKRPTDYERGEVGLSFGNNHRRQLTLDTSGPLSETLSYRFVALGREADGAYDHTADDRAYVAPSLTWRPDEYTSLTLLASYQKNKALAPSNIPWAAVNGSSPYGKVPMERFIGEPDFDFEEVESTSVGYEFSHAFDDTWTFRQNLRFSDYDNQENYLARVSGLVTGSDGVPNASIRRNYQLRHAYGEHLALDNQLQARFATGPVQHTTLLGVDYSWSRSVRNEKWGNATPLNVFDPVYGAAVDTSAYTAWVNNRQRTTQLGYYFQDQLKYDRWVMTLGGRQDYARSRTTDRWTGTETADQDWDDFTGRAGLVYLFDNGFAPYVSYAESFNPVTGSSAPERGGKNFEPERGKQYEVGVRYQPPGSETQITLSLYDLRKENAITNDPLNERYSIQTGEIRSKGVELEAIATVAEDLKLTGSLSYSDVEVTKSNDGNQGKQPFKVPAKLASIWADYSVPFDPLQGLSIGIGARYTGYTYGDALNTFEVPSYTLYDAAVRYDLSKLDPTLQGVKASVNVNNLTDKYYVASCFFSLACNMGEGRSVVAEVSYQW